MIMSCFFLTPAWAVVEVYDFPEEGQEERFKQLIAEMRCPMCLNSNIAGSDAAIAADLRAEVFDQILEGKSDEEIMGFMTDRYGDFINYRPPLNRSTILLWFGPGLLLILGFIIALRMMRSSQLEAGDTKLSNEETKKLEDILSSHQDS